jgi:hypothetical protein
LTAEHADRRHDERPTIELKIRGKHEVMLGPGGGERQTLGRPRGFLGLWFLDEVWHFLAILDRRRVHPAG